MRLRPGIRFGAASPMRSWRLSTPADRSWRSSAAHFTFTPSVWQAPFPNIPMSWHAFQSVPKSRFAWIRASPRSMVLAADTRCSTRRSGLAARAPFAALGGSLRSYRSLPRTSGPVSEVHASKQGWLALQAKQNEREKKGKILV